MLTLVRPGWLNTDPIMGSRRRKANTRGKKSLHAHVHQYEDPYPITESTHLPEQVQDAKQFNSNTNNSPSTKHQHDTTNETNSTTDLGFLCEESQRTLHTDCQGDAWKKKYLYHLLSYPSIQVLISLTFPMARRPASKKVNTPMSINSTPTAVRPTPISKACCAWAT